MRPLLCCGIFISRDEGLARSPMGIASCTGCWWCLGLFWNHCSSGSPVNHPLRRLSSAPTRQLPVSTEWWKSASRFELKPPKNHHQLAAFHVSAWHLHLRSCIVAPVNPILSSRTTHTQHRITNQVPRFTIPCHCASVRRVMHCCDCVSQLLRTADAPFVRP